ncbi:hypothetical protein GCM10009743_55870 [Kribbella swartbergensis]
MPPYDASDRPFLLLDIDGPLNPYRAKVIPPGYQRHEIVEGDKTWIVLLNQQHGVRLNLLAETFDLVWATSWEHGANRLLAPLLGLPELPVISWPPRESVARVRRGSWKTPYVAEWVGDRPFVWVDDEVNRHDRFFLSKLHSSHLLHRVEASRGLTAADFVAIQAWADRNSFAGKAFRRDDGGTGNTSRGSRPDRAGGSSTCDRLPCATSGQGGAVCERAPLIRVRPPVRVRPLVLLLRAYDVMLLTGPAVPGPARLG